MHEGKPVAGIILPDWCRRGNAEPPTEAAPGAAYFVDEYATGTDAVRDARGREPSATGAGSL